MDIKEFVRLDPKQIRQDKGLMQLFVDFYKAAFSFEPKCAGCSFKGNFKKLKRYADGEIKNINFIKKTMETKTFVLKNSFKNKILTYKKNGVTYRKYGHAITEEFARELVEAGKGEVFSKLPSSETLVETLDVNYEYVDKYSGMGYKDEIVPLYLKVKEATGKKADSMRKADIIKFLKENEG